MPCIASGLSFCETTSTGSCLVVVVVVVLVIINALTSTTHSLSSSFFFSTVYEEFKDLARSDNVAGFSYGMECLYRFYSYGLEKYFRRGPFEDFTKYVLEDFKNGE